MPFPLLTHAAFEAQVDQSGAALALSWAGGQLTYDELDARANRLARRLRESRVRPGALVAVLLERSPELVCSLLAVLKTGAAYLPLDPADPPGRLAWLCEDSRAEALLTRGDLAERLPARPPALIDAAAAGGADATRLAGGATPADLAYVIYTSGSTGRPKGVLVPHVALAHHGAAVRDRYGLGPSDRVLQFASFAFDVAAEEVFATLASGAALVLRPDPLPDSFAGFSRFVERERLTVLNLPASFWHAWVDELERGGAAPPECLRLVVAGSEAVSAERLVAWRRLAGERVRWLNAYGPTEATITATAYEPPAGAGGDGSGTVPIGRPLGPVRTLLLDAALRPAGSGDEGELCLGGPTLAYGYLGRPDLTAERFVPDPFASAGGERLYRTGDLARQRSDGELEFRGRIDHQVKVRGFRIELGEVEAALLGHPAVERAAVVAREVAPGDNRLVAYTAGAGAPSARELRAFLRRRLPEPLVPSWFVRLRELPLLASGKVDRRALPAPEPGGGEEHAPPRTPLEEVLAALFAQLLGVERVGVDDDFFELGGHSLLASRLAARLREALRVELPLPRLFDAPTVAALAAAVERSAGAGATPELPPIVRRPRPGPFPLSFPQERVWFLSQLAPESIAYNTQLAVHLRGPLERSALAVALAEIVRRHEVFRTSFELLDGRPVQWVHPPPPVPLPLVDLRGLPPAARERAAAELSRREFRWRFDVARPPLVRWTLLRLDEEEHCLLQVEHHFVHDGWSLAVLFRELRQLYLAFAAGRPSPLPELPVQFGDFAAWQREWMQGEVLARELAWWRERLTGMPPVLELPADRPRPRVQSFRGGGRTLTLPGELFERLRELGRRHHATPFMTLLAAFEVLLFRVTGQEDLVVGSSIANRRLRESEDLIGMIVNNLVLRTDLSGDLTFPELLARVREVTLAAYAHQDVPFEKLVEVLRPERDLGRNPLFQVAFGFHDSAMPDLDLGAVSGRIDYAYNDWAKFDLNVVVVPPRGTEEKVQVLWEYSADLFDPTTVQRLHRQWRTLLEAIAARPQSRVGALALLAAEERQQLLREWNDTRVDFAVAPTLERLIAAQVERTPDAPAVASEGEALSYRELDARAGRLARHLRGLGVGPETPVGICLERSLELMVGLLAILKAGGAYVPLDPEYPRERLAFMVEDALGWTGAPVVLTQTRLAGLLPPGAARLVRMDADWPAVAAQPAGPPPLDDDPDRLAYVIYTSGSTGRPKGAMNAHRGIVNRLLWMQRAYGLAPDDRVLQKTPFSFDVSVWELFWPLLVGAQLVMARPGGHQDPAYLVRTIRERGITTLHFVPSMLRAFLEAPGVERCASLRRVFASGEALPRELEQRFFARLGAELHNLYGPTEAAVDVTYHACRAERERPAVPIGRPVANTRLHVLDRELRPVPVDVPGELCIGGVQLARGYLRRPELTAERFVPDPCAERPGRRLYRTGDLARRLPDGELEFLGRLDHQIKLRGFRIELGEIEAVLAEHPAVHAAAVAVQDERLLAFAVPLPGSALPDREALRAYLAARLPEHMVPWTFVELAALPLTPSGKVDRSALPVAAGAVAASPSGEEPVPPSGPLEEALARMVARALGLKQVGVQDRFFALGGHSLSAARLLLQLAETFGVELPLRSFFEQPTVAGLASALVAGEASPGHCETAARLLLRIEAMTPEEVAAGLRARQEAGREVAV